MLPNLSVSSNGSTWVKLSTRGVSDVARLPFSILERIDVGETSAQTTVTWTRSRLSVSSNGSTWVKPVRQHLGWQRHESFSILERIDVGETETPAPYARGVLPFQYPRTDRRG